MANKFNPNKPSDIKKLKKEMLKTKDKMVADAIKKQTVKIDVVCEKCGRQTSVTVGSKSECPNCKTVISVIPPK